MLTADLHTHTRYSHGKGTVEQSVQKALSLGLSALAVSEHNRGHMFYGVGGKKLDALHRDVEDMNAKYGDRIQVLHGVEANLLGNGVTDLQPNYREYFSVVLLGYHKGVWPGGKDGIRWTMELAFGKNKALAERNALCMAHALEKYPGIFAVTHPGLYIPMDIKTLAKACADCGAAFELNGGHSGLTLEMVEEAMKVDGLNFLLSSDAHSPDRVGDVASALAIAKEAGILHRVINWKEV